VRRPEEFNNWRSRRPSYGPYAAVVRHVVDGDTIDCLVDLGINIYVYEVVRLAGLNAPESNRAATMTAGRAAKVYLEAQLPPGTRVVLATKPDPDSFGRYIAGVTRADDGVDVNALLVASGYAERRTDYD
jgi:endonuclease YncB( thermonuclease family)